MTRAVRLPTRKEPLRPFSRVAWILLMGKAKELFMRTLSAIACIMTLVGCATTPMVAIHGSETDKNHFVIISDGATDYYWDCYSREAGGAWEPTCREIRKQRYFKGKWDEPRPVVAPTKTN